jgi:uncharacterized SAM-binding protein YcdF (DUF218 family)
MNVILVLGGDPARNTEAARVINEVDSSAIIVVSSDTALRTIDGIYKTANVAPHVIWYDFNAWDTVTNFTETFRWVMARKPRRVYVITSDYHMRRSMAIGRVVYFLTGVRLVPIVHKSNDLRRREPLAAALNNALRAAWWRISGNPGGPRSRSARMPWFNAAKLEAINLGLQVVDS